MTQLVALNLAKSYANKPVVKDVSSVESRVEIVRGYGVVEDDDLPASEAIGQMYGLIVHRERCGVSAMVRLVVPLVDGASRIVDALVGPIPELHGVAVEPGVRFPVRKQYLCCYR